MKNRKTKLHALLLVLVLLIAMLAGCSKSASGIEEPVADSYVYETPDEPATEAPSSPEPETAIDESLTSSADQLAGGTETVPRNSLAEKIIYTGYQYIETTDFDAAIESLETMVTEFGGFMESTNVDGSTSYIDGTNKLTDRSANYVVRIPCARFSEFLKRSGTLGNVLNSSTTAENITSQFTDAEARKKSLLTQEERLLAMMEKADTTETLIELESRLSEVRYEIEALERQLVNWQNSVDYSTCQLSLREVADYTPVVPVQRTFGEKLNDSLARGWRGFKDFVKAVILCLAEALPVLVLLAVITAAILLLVRIYRRAQKKKQIRYAKPVNPAEDQQNPDVK